MFLEKASRDNKRVLAMFGGDWCGWCHLLHNTFKTDRAVSKLLRYEYELVMIDTKAKGVAELMKRWNSPMNGCSSRCASGFGLTKNFTAMRWG